MCIACNTSLDLSKRDAFSERLIGILNASAASLMISLGHRTGLFDFLGDGLPRTSQQIATKTGLNERYVREWLNGLVAAEIVERDPAQNQYHLPAEHAHWLTRTSPTANIAVYAQYIPLLGSVEDQVLECFHQGGGVPYSAYPRFQDVMAEDSGQSIVPIIVDQVVPLAPGLHERLTGGIDVLDIGCGQGRALTQLARAYPASRFVGYDLSTVVVDADNRAAQKAGLTNLRFVQQDLTHWQETEAFDWILALDAIHDQAAPATVLRSVRRALRPGGLFLMQDIDASTEPTDNIAHPIGTLLYGMSLMHCMTVSLAQGGAGLGTAWGIQLAETMLNQAGFSSVTVHRFEHDFQNAYFFMPV